MEELLELLSSLKPGTDFKNSQNMVEEGLIDSFDMINIVANINMKFDIDFPVSEIVPENFVTVETLYKTIERIKNS